MRSESIAQPPRQIPADNHVHTEWSWDATHGNMDATCRRAVELGLAAVAFTEHADFVHGPGAVFDAGAYLECIERCRVAYPGLRILSGVELGEPHRFPEQTRALLAAGFERVVASVHGVTWDGRFRDASERGFLSPENSDRYFRMYLEETEALLASDVPFEVLTHLDYPKRYWPANPPFDAAAYEAEIRAVLRAAARRGTVLEVNTTRGGEPGRYMCPGPVVIAWWRDEGGRAVSLGSDAHRPEDVAAGLALAREVVSAAGFARADELTGYWLR